MIDIGCGPGMIGVALKELRWKGKLFGLDIAEKRLMKASQNSLYSSCVQADANSLPFGNSIFDLVLSSAMVGLTGTESIREMIRILKSGGLLACVAGELRNRRWCRKRFQESVQYFKDISSSQIIAQEDLGSGWKDDYDNEHYIYYLIRKK